MKKILALICVVMFALRVVEAQTNDVVKQAGSPGVVTSKAEASPELEEAARLNRTVFKLFGEGKYDEALPLAKRVLEIREKTFGGEHLQVAYALSNLASIYIEKGKGGDAEPLLKRALIIVENGGGGVSNLAADINTQLGMSRLWKNDYKEAEPFLLRALEINEQAHGPIVPALLNLADLYFLRRDFETARGHLARALEILAKQPPKKDLATAKRLKNYQCPLFGVTEAKDVKLAAIVWHEAWRLEEPEKAAEFERLKKEKEARGESDKTIVAGGVLNGHAVSKPAPTYPDEAKRSRIMGTVVIKILVDEQGKVIEAEAICGDPLLGKASVEAARKARFTPTLLSGSPVKVSGIINYNFVLQ